MISIIQSALKKNTISKPILVCGDVMLDWYVFGRSHRLNPEAPVPVVHVDKDEYRLGGAGNAAMNIAASGTKTALLAIIGEDSAGEQISSLLHNGGVDERNIIIRPEHTTMVKQRILTGYPGHPQQQVVRVDRERVANMSWSFSGDLNEYSDVVLASDYGKGMIHQSITQLFPGKKIIVDPKPQNAKHYLGAYVVTPNRKESLEIVDREPDDVVPDMKKHGAEVRDRLQIEHLLLTDGSRGMYLFSDQEAWHVLPLPTDVADVSGAGDTVIAWLSIGVELGLSLLQSAVLANTAAAISVTKPTTATVDVTEILSKLEQLPDQLVTELK